MVYPIYLYGSSVLRKESVDIDQNYPELDTFIADMFDTMADSEGIGLAAPQVGKNINLFVVDATAFGEEDPNAADFKKVFINAEIYERSGEKVPFIEGCLSVPGVRENVDRYDVIKVRYMDENFIEHDEELDGIRARVVQHEYDHIEGALFTDRIAPIRKTLNKCKLTKIAKGKISAAYRTKLVK